MQLSKITGLVELQVVIDDGSELRFRVGALVKVHGRARRFWCRIYRLEAFRFQARSAGVNGVRWLGADYRCWVVDDNFDIENSVHNRRPLL